ncbi:hypothetical protein [Streptomyces sp. NPDC001665]
MQHCYVSPDSGPAGRGSRYPGPHAPGRPGRSKNKRGAGGHTPRRPDRADFRCLSCTAAPGHGPFPGRAGLAPCGPESSRTPISGDPAPARIDDVRLAEDAATARTADYGRLGPLLKGAGLAVVGLALTTGLVLMLHRQRAAGGTPRYA